MNFLALEILAWLVASSAFGILIGWLMQASLGKRRLARSHREWDTRLQKLQAATTSQLNDLNDRNDSLENQVTTLRNRLQASNADRTSTDNDLLKLQAENKTLKDTIRIQEESMEQASREFARQSAESDLQQKQFDTLLNAKELELNSLRQQLAERQSSANIQDFPEIDGDDTALAEQLRDLHAQQEQLELERAHLARREAIISSELPFGDDTQAYFDQTIRVDPPDETDKTQNLDATVNQTMAGETDQTIAASKKLNIRSLDNDPRHEHTLSDMAAEPRKSEPRKSEPRKSEPRKSEPRKSEPRATEPKAANKSAAANDARPSEHRSLWQRVKRSMIRSPEEDKA